MHCDMHAPVFTCMQRINNKDRVQFENRKALARGGDRQDGDGMVTIADDCVGLVGWGVP